LHVVLDPDDANSKIISAFENEVGKILALVARKTWQLATAQERYS